MSAEEFTTEDQTEVLESHFKAAMEDLAARTTDYGLMFVPLEDGVGFYAALLHTDTGVEVGKAADANPLAAGLRAIGRGLTRIDEIAEMAREELT